VVVAVHLCFLPWALGTMHVWSQSVSLALAAFSFSVALWPRIYKEEFSRNGRSFRLVVRHRLLTFPIFWIGAIFLCYVLVQALNPAWRRVADARYSWLVALSHAKWLPHGMETPFGMASPWRSLLVYGSAWMTACAVWVGFTRRKTLQILFTILAINAFALAALGIAERSLNADKIFWEWKPPASYFVASFIYKNHAGAYFNLLLSLCAGLAAWNYSESRRRQRTSSPSGLFAFFVMVLALIVIFSYSRAATVLMLGYLGFLLVLFVVKQLLSPNRSRRDIAILALLGALFGGSFLLGLSFLPTEKVLEHMDALATSYKSAMPNDRYLATRATLDMFRASPVYGWGAGSFRFAFPAFQRSYPVIYSMGNMRLYWEHAHNDYAELLAELGIVGTTLLAAGGVYYLTKLARLHFWGNSLSLLLFVGCMITLLHCAVDFNFYNPAILVTWCAFWPALVRWSKLDGTTGNGRQSSEAEARPKSQDRVCGPSA